MNQLAQVGTGRLLLLLLLRSLVTTQMLARHDIRGLYKNRHLRHHRRRLMAPLATLNGRRPDFRMQMLLSHTAKNASVWWHIIIVTPIGHDDMALIWSAGMCWIKTHPPMRRGLHFNPRMTLRRFVEMLYMQIPIDVPTRHTMQAKKSEGDVCEILTHTSTRPQAVVAGA